MSKRGTHILSGPDTARYGCIVSFEATPELSMTRRVGFHDICHPRLA